MDYYYSTAKKNRYGKIAAQLRALAAELGIDKKDYIIRPCYGGMAVPGEAILHAETLYVNVPLFRENLSRGYFRSCKGRDDYTGGQNHSFSGELPTAAEIRRALPVFRQSAMAGSTRRG